MDDRPPDRHPDGEPNPFDAHAGTLTGVHPPGFLEELRDEWAPRGLSGRPD
ncbi:MAG TPA: hypothetical protein PKD59_17285 [Miltoncostaeaceae bacterium]|nr:hypothetical protein [Miltoncostaeaceae bacterium]